MAPKNRKNSESNPNLDKNHPFFFNTTDYFGSNTAFKNKTNIDIGKDLYDIKSIKLNYFNSQHF